ncbi:MAG: T9SS type A sorting domain-containing protein [Bacteroidia bacterium]|nr:T9SS type A sorting domain-containing protein [Bacteroidia bacterium]
MLLLKNFTQLGNTAQILTLTGTAVASFNGSTFNGEITVSSPGILLKNSTFNGMSNFTKTGTSNAQSDGGNVFNYATTISNTAASGRIRMATVSGDTYNADATFNSTGQDVQVAYSGDNTFAGNITINSNKVVFNTSTGKVTFTGTNNQTLNGSYNYPFKKLSINKTAGTVTANTTLSVDDSLIFIQGKLITTSSNLLTMKHGSTATGASNSSFVSGPVKKVGNTAFVFDVGSGNTYRPLTITAPTNTSDAFTAEYYNAGQTLGNTKDTTITFVSDCGYWKLDRNVGSSNITPKFAFDSLHCDYLTVKPVHIALWNGTKWTDKGEAVTESTNKSTNSAMSSYGYFAFAYDLKPGDAPQYPLNVQTSSICSGMDVEFNQKEFWISFDVDSALFKIALFSPQNDSIYAPIEKLEVFDNYEVGQTQALIEGWNFDCDSMFQTTIRKTAVLDISKQYLLKVTRYMPEDCAGITETLDYFLNFCLMNIRTNPTCTTYFYNSAAKLKDYLGDINQGGQAVNGDIVAPDPAYPNLDIDVSGYPPLTIEEGVTLTGNYDLLSNDINISSLNLACPFLTYQDNNTSPYGTIIRKNVKGEMIMRVLQDEGYMFFMYGQSRVQNLKLVGGLPGYQDYNEDKWLSSCIKMNPGLLGPNSIQNCDISQFAYSGMFMQAGTQGTDIVNSFIHRIKGSGGGDTQPKGYGIWFQGINNDSNIPEANLFNCFFDECKTAIDDQGYSLHTLISGCTFGRFFNQETLNRHNNSGLIYSHPPISSPASCPFYVGTASNSTSTNFSIGDKVDGNYSVTGSIFYKRGNVISSPYPVGFDALNNIIPYTFTLGNNTFSEPKAVSYPYNYGGYARIADNYLDACVWDDDKLNGTFVTTQNTHDYVPGFTSFTPNTPKPVEPKFSFSSINGTVPGFSTTTPEVPFINQGDDFEVLVSAPGTNAVHIIRAHPSNNNAIGGANHQSGNNAYNNAEVITAPSTSQVSVSFGPTAVGPNNFDSNKPGLYGVDVMSIDASGSDYKVSQLIHKPIIVAPTDNHLLIFNIKDSYYADSYDYTVLTGNVYKQVELNGNIIWREHIQLGGDDWEQVQINLFQDLYQGTPIRNHLKLNEKNTITFSIGLPVPSLVSTEELRGLFVWIDDVYLKKFDSPENLIMDGDIENSEVAGLSNQPTATQPWYQKNAEQFAYYSLDYSYDPAVDFLPIPANSNKKAESHASVSILERKSGTNAISLELEGIHASNSSFFPTPLDGTINTNFEVISAAIDFDAKYFLGCSEVASMNGVQEITNSDIVGTKVFPDGKYIIRQPLEVQSGEILEFAGSSYFIDATSGPVTITVKHDGLLKIYNANGFPSRLFSCEDMWDGIIVEDGGRVEIYPSSSYPTEIYDAMTAIEVEGGSSTTKPLNIRYALFDHNYIGLDLSDADYYNGLLTASDGILGIDFKCSSGKIQKQPFEGMASYAHIQLRNVSDIIIGGIGSPTAYQNTFSDAVYGIRIEKDASSTVDGTIKIVNCKFDKMSEYLDSQPPSPITGCGIFAQTWSAANTTIEMGVGGTTSTAKNIFSNSQNGIILNGNITSIIKGNEFSNLTQGIRLFANNNPVANPTSVIINDDNVFYHVSTGIYANRMRCPVEISSNQFSNIGYNPVIPPNSPLSFRNTAITVQNPVTGINDVVRIFGNTLNDNRIGIHTRNISGVSIGSDTEASPYTGTPNFIYFNQLEFTSNHRGIWVESCPGAKIQENTIRNFSTAPPTSGILFTGIALNESIDNFVNKNSCIELPTAMAIRGDNADTELHCNVIENILLNGNGINLTNASLPDQGDLLSGATWDNLWYGFSSMFGITGFPNGPFAWLYDDDLTEYNPNADPFTLIPTLVPNALNDACTIQAANPTPFRDARYARIAEDSLEFTSHISEFTYKQLDFLYKKLNKDTLLLYQSTSKDSVFQNFYNYNLNSNFGIFARVDSLIRAGNLSTAFSLNNSINDTNQIESNLKGVNSIIISKILLDSALTTADSLTLFDIAWQDPITGGRGVFYARAILFLEIEDNAASSRFGGSLNQIEPLKQEEESGFKVFPNPTSDQCMALFSASTSKYVLELRDAVGKLLNSYEISPGSQSKLFSVSYLSPGIYLISLKNQQNIVKYTQLIIQR